MKSASINGWDSRVALKNRSESTYIDIGEDEFNFYDYNSDDPVIISFPFPHKKGPPQSIPVGKTSCSPITLENTTSDPIELWGVKIYCSNPADSFTLSLMEPPSETSSSTRSRGFVEDYFLEDRVLQPFQKLTIWLSCKPKETGLHSTLLHFDVGDDRFERMAYLIAEDDVSLSLAAKKSYSKAPKGKQKFNVDDVVPLESKPSSKSGSRKSKNILPEFPIPNHTRKLLESKKTPKCFIEGLKPDNYFIFFSTLLIMEELNNEKEMCNHSLEAVCMRQKKMHMVLEIPGVADKKPELVPRDDVFARNSLDNSSKPIVYKGKIICVYTDKLHLSFPKEFHELHTEGNFYDVQFSNNRTNFRRLYQAVEMVERIDRDFVFPSQLEEKRVVKQVDLKPFTGNLNMEQRHSVSMIVGCKGPPPYVIFGPPGTGKTKTLVEAILQLYANFESSRILVCAASNSAADHILEKLISNENIEIKDNKVFRLNATGRSYDDIDINLKQFCYSDIGTGVFSCPPLKALIEYKIIISTYSSSLMLYGEGLNRGHFSHILLDESGQASEPECMVPIGNFCESDTVVVLAGDPRQLGPVVRSKDAQDFGLGKSFLDRLFEYDFYANEDRDYVTKLVRNYRCHPAILHLPSKLFYNGELMACKQESLPFSSSSLNFIHNQEFLVCFVGVQSCEEREGNNPSWFNRIEVSKVVDIVRKLTDSRSVEENDVGVISPYRQQVMKIKKTMADWGIEGVKVGSVEQFQGQEREVIIISTVRSTLKPNEFDSKSSIGFLSNFRRFNVAITRAKSLLIIVGNPLILRQDEYWNKLLCYCVENNSYHGNPLPEKTFEEEEPEKFDTPDWENDWS